jgi:hypothetical protein
LKEKMQKIAWRQHYGNIAVESVLVEVEVKLGQIIEQGDNPNKEPAGHHWEKARILKTEGLG